MAGVPPYQPYLDVPPSPFRWRLGLRPLDLADWLEVDDDRVADLAEKQRVMTEHPTTAFCALDDVIDESAEVLDEIVAWLDRAGVGDGLPDRSLHPLDAAGRLVQEDLVLLVERDGAPVCGGGSVCFPNRWDLRSKVGRTMAEIHAPVAELNDTLEAPINKFLMRLTADRSYWRLGWGVLDTPALYQAVDGTADPRPAAATPADHHLRVERETLRRLPRTGAILFTIRTHMSPLGAVPAGATRQLAEAIRALPPAVASYKQLDDVGDELADWLLGLAADGLESRPSLE
ncbi:MAG: DUF3445 domain-containing protein [Ilumatobacter sp.]|nr:DUF3445 domain-containing protein [Ilumatobacter sp.]